LRALFRLRRPFLKFDVLPETARQILCCRRTFADPNDVRVLSSATNLIVLQNYLLFQGLALFPKKDKLEGSYARDERLRRLPQRAGYAIKGTDDG